MVPPKLWRRFHDKIGRRMTSKFQTQGGDQDQSRRISPLGDNTNAAERGHDHSVRIELKTYWSGKESITRVPTAHTLTASNKSIFENDINTMKQRDRSVATQCPDKSFKPFVTTSNGRAVPPFRFVNNSGKITQSALGNHPRVSDGPSASASATASIRSNQASLRKEGVALDSTARQNVQAKARKRIQKRASCPNVGVHHSRSFSKRAFWNDEDDALLLRLVREHGCACWTKISVHFPNRTPNALRTRWLYKVNPELLKTPFSTGEDRTILNAKRNGFTTAQLRPLVPGRADVKVSNRFKSVIAPRIASLGKHALELTENDIEDIIRDIHQNSESKHA